MKEKRKKLLFNTILVLVPLLFSLMLSELLLRSLMSEELELRSDERSKFYSHHDTLGWFPVRNSKGLFRSTNEINVEHNSRGFRDEEHTLTDKKRMMIIGDSFVWGFNVEENERFTEQLDSLMPDWSNYNLGVSGYGTDQEYLLLQNQFDYYDPEVVLLVYCVDNDRLDTTVNKRYRHYYKPYYSIKGDSLYLQGVPVPKGERYQFQNNSLLSDSYIFRLIMKRYYSIKHPLVLLEKDPSFAILTKMNNFVKSKNRKFIVGLQKNDSTIVQFLNSENIEHINLENDFVFSFSGHHWTPQGHKYVAEQIKDFF